jgi:hypothetical protein
MFEEVTVLIDKAVVVERDDFFHAMKILSMLGLRTEDVTLQYTPETILRWINGSRCPHAEMRKYLLSKFVEVMREKVEVDTPREFVRAGEDIK